MHVMNNRRFGEAALRIRSLSLSLFSIWPMLFDASFHHFTGWKKFENVCIYCDSFFFCLSLIENQNDKKSDWQGRQHASCHPTLSTWWSKTLQKSYFFSWLMELLGIEPSNLLSTFVSFPLHPAAN